MHSTDFRTTTRIAQTLGIDPSGARRRLEAAQAEGRIERDRRGHWHAATALEILRAEVDPARVAGHNANARGDHGAPEVNTLAKARAEAETERARKLKIENARRAGELVAVEDVRQAGANIVVRARAAFLSLGPRVSDRLVNVTDRTEIETIIEAEARAILKELADPTAFVDSLLGLP
jgi:hypothetical protein